MARCSGALAVLALALLAASVAADPFGKGKGMHMPVSTGKGNSVVNEDVQCDQVCQDVCTPVPNKVCNEVPYQTQVCNQVQIQKTKQVCNRICTQTTTTTEVLATGKGKGAPVMMGKGKGYGRRRLAGVIKGKLAAAALVAAVAGKSKAEPVVMPVAHYGKGAAPQVDVQCNDQCNDVPYTTYDTQCQMVTKTRTKCDVVFTQQCNKVCKPICKKITTVTTTSSQTLSTGKGSVAVVPMGKGKGWGRK